METKTLLAAIISFMLGGLVVATAAATINKPEVAKNNDHTTMANMAARLSTKTGDDYDAAFLAGMIEHHQDAVDMTKQSAANAKHQELKTLSTGILIAQQKEIDLMKQWQKAWGYAGKSTDTHMAH